jgi:hypothetical protein
MRVLFKSVEQRLDRETHSTPAKPLAATKAHAGAFRPPQALAKIEVLRLVRPSQYFV